MKKQGNFSQRKHNIPKADQNVKEIDKIPVKKSKRHTRIVAS